MRNLLLSALVFLITISSFAASVDTVSIYSNAMHKDYKCVVIKPYTKKAKNNSYPVVYLLHGYSGDYSNWITKVPALKEYADEYKMMIVCPDGAYSSWYFDSPVDSNWKFETYISNEVPAYIDAHYPVSKDRKARAITGLSMGGHGALFLSFRHADEFGACGAMSGGVELHPFSTKWDLAKRLGDTLNHADNWINYSVLHTVETPPGDSLAIIIDCGTEDFFYTVNHKLHEKLLKLKIPHDYIERPGQHNWNYWSNAVKYQLLFFRDYFKRNK